MRNETVPGRRVGRAFMAILVVGAVAGVVGAETVAIKRPLDVLDGKAGTADIVETVERNQTLDVLGREGNWVRVRTAGGKQGFVPQAALADSQGAGLDLSTITGGPSASEMSAGAAGKGFNEVDQYASSHNLSQDGLHRMIQLRNSVNSADFRKFTQEGNVGAGRSGK